MLKQTIVDVRELVTELHDAARRLLSGNVQTRVTGLELHLIADQLADTLRHLEASEAQRAAVA